MSIFEESEFEGLISSQVQQKGNEIQQRFQQRRNYFHQVRNSALIDSDKWNELNKKIVEFDSTVFKNWNQNWSQISRQQNTSQYISHFKKGDEIFSEFDEILKTIKPSYEHSDDVESLKEEILSKVDNDINNLSEEIKEQVGHGIQNLIELKAEYKLQDTFAVSIKTQKENSKTSKNIFLFLFIFSLLLIPSFLLKSFEYEKIISQNEKIQWAIRITCSITLGILSIFLFNQYKIYHLIYLKYSHLHNFIGGGATFISELIGLEDNSKRDFNKKVANMFIEIDDIMSSIKKIKHPTENITELSSESINSVSKNLINGLKNINKSA